VNELFEIGLLAQKPGGLPPQAIWIGLIIMFIIFYVVMLSPQRKEKKKRQEMLAAVKKTDRVMTIGGIIGTVVAVGDDEISIKIDESTNVKISLTRNAIQKVLADEETSAKTT